MSVQRELTMEDVVSILRRRKWMLLVTAIVGTAIGYGSSLFFANRYTSRTTILVEQPTVPSTYVKPVVTEELDQRLVTMQEQILSRSRLQPIIEQYGVFKQEGKNASMDELVDRLRKAIEVQPVLPMAGTEQRAQLPGFIVAVTLPDARQAQQICTQITSMFMEENLRLRQSQAEDTTDFLSKQLDEAKQKLDEQDAKLAAFERQYLGQLPGETNTNLNLLMGMTTQLDVATQQLQRAQQDKIFVETQLAQQLETWHASLSGGKNPQSLEKQLADLEAQLTVLEARYTPDHPDVMKAKRDIESLKKQIADANAKDSKKGPGDSTDKPMTAGEPQAIQQLRAQVHQLDATIREKTHEQEQLQTQIRTLQGRLQMTPLVEQQYKQITRDYNAALEFYNDLLKKKQASAMATDLERRQQGEQFRVLDPPNLPERPTFPNRPLFGLGGLAGGLALGFGITLILTVQDKSLRTQRDVESLLQIPVLASINQFDVKHRKGLQPQNGSVKEAGVRLPA